MGQECERLTMTIPEFAEATGCSKNLCYLLARQNKLPVPVIYIGEKRMCVSRKAVASLLSGETQQAQGKRGGIPTPYAWLGFWGGQGW